MRFFFFCAGDHSLCGVPPHYRSRQGNPRDVILLGDRGHVRGGAGAPHHGAAHGMEVGEMCKNLQNL